VEVRKLPKIKTHKSTSKRFKYSGSGKLMRTKIGKSHLRRKKSRRVKAQFPEMHEVKDAGTKKRLKKLAPYLD
jgi:large subunit ribosomal protein L35